MSSIIIITIVAIAILFLGIYKMQKALLPTAILGLLCAAISLTCEWNQQNTYFNNMLMFDNFAIAFSIAIISVTALILALSTDYFERISNDVAEYYAILLFSLAGGIVMTAFQNLSTLFIGIEILSVSMYIMTGIKKRDTISNEAALKYFLMGSFATGILLFGVALIYGATGSFDLETIAKNAAVDPTMFYAGALFLLIAMMFKTGVAPFHFWTPDVYQGAPSLVTAFMSTVVKTAAFATFIRLFSVVFKESMLEWTTTTTTIVVCIALTLVIGNITAAFQQKVKRILAYSSISHAGYMLIAVLAIATGASADAMFFYSVAYSVASVAVFGVLIAVKNQLGSDDISSFNGLAKTNPLMSFVMTIGLCSLAGIPLTAGFFGKFNMFGLAISQGYIPLVFIAILTAAVGIFYYFRIIIAMYMKESHDNNQVSVPVFYKFVLVLCAVITITLGLAPGFITKLI